MHAGQIGQHFNLRLKFERHYPIIPFGTRQVQKGSGNLATSGSRFTGLLFTLWFSWCDWCFTVVFSSTVTKGRQSWWVYWLSRHHPSSSFVTFYLNCFFSVRLSLILMKLGMN